MSKEATRNALAQLTDDAEASAKVATGDFEAIGDPDLTDAERALLQAAASELAENDVSGFITLDNGLKHGNITLDNGLKFMPGVRQSLDYISFTYDK